jgi:hypothetical protein
VRTEEKFAVGGAELKIRQGNVTVSERALVIEVLEKFFPDECDLAGPANVRKVAEGNAEFVRAEYGANLDLTQVLTILAPVAVIINNAISAYKNSGREAARQQGVEGSGGVGLQPLPGVTADQLEVIYEYVLRRLQEGGAAPAPPAPAPEAEPGRGGK